MAIIPFKPTGIGQVAAKNVFKISFSQALSTIPKLKAWDDYNLNTVVNDIFVGTSVNGNLPLIGAVGLESAPGASWWPSGLTVNADAGTATRMKGSSGYCKLASVAPEAAGEVFFNLDYKIPSDLQPSSTVNHVLAVECQYTGATPTIRWYANRGTEGTPDWIELLPRAQGYQMISGDTEIRPTDSGEGYDGTQNYKISIPDSSEEFADEIWVKDKD